MGMILLKRVAYKLVRKRRDGSLGSLFINKKAIIPIGTWLESEDHFTKGYKHRPGWHLTFKKFAPHLSMKDRVWVKAEVDDYEVHVRPISQGGRWILAKRMKVIEICSRGECNLNVSCLGSRSWLDVEAVSYELSSIKYKCNSPITINHRGNEGVDKIVDSVGRREGFSVLRSEDLLNEDTDMLLFFKRNGNTEDDHIVEEAKSMNIPVKIINGW